MSRFNNPQTQPPRRPQAAGQSAHPQQPYEPDLQGWGPPPQGQQPPRHYRQEPPPQAMPPQQPFSHSPYGGEDEHQHRDPYAALRSDAYQQAAATPHQLDPYAGYQGHQPPQPAAPPRAPQPAYPPSQYDAYASLSGPYGAPPQRQDHAGYVGAVGVPPPQAPEAYPPRSDFRQSGYENWPQPAPTAGYPPQPQNYDALQPHDPAYQDPGYDDGYGEYPQQPAFGATPQAGPQAWGAADPYGVPPGLEPGFNDQHAAYGAAPQAGQPGFFEQSYADETEEYEEEPPRRSWTKIAAVIGMFVVLGGGFTYAYNTLLGGPVTPDGGTPVVRGDTGPFKVKPSDPGGKTFDHSDSKIMGRLGEGGVASPGSGEVDPATGARKVSTLVVGRDGSIQAPAASEAAPATTATVSVPGLTVIGGLDTPSGPEERPAPASLPQERTVTASEPQTAVVVEPPKAPSPPAKVQTAAVTPPAEKKAPAPAKKVAAAPVTPGVTSAGYVVVLASVPASESSRMDALKQFADMQQKYGDILQNKMPDVREADLGAKGTYHRLLVGPPGSRELASQLCTQLKEQGYPSCWVTAY